MRIIEQRLGTNEALDELEEDARVFISEAQQAEDDFQFQKQEVWQKHISNIFNMLEQDSSLKSKVSHQFDPKTLEKFHDVMRSRDQRPHFSRPEISRFEASWTESIPARFPMTLNSTRTQAYKASRSQRSRSPRRRSARSRSESSKATAKPSSCSGSRSTSASA